MLAIYLGFLTAFPILICGLLQYNFLDLDNPSYLARMETIYLGIKRNRLALTYTTMFCLRRLGLALLLAVKTETGLAIPLFYLIQHLYICYLLWLQPNQSKFENILELMGEILLLFLIYLQHFFSVLVDVEVK